MMNHASSLKREWIVIALGLLGGAVFFSSLGNLWPLANIDLAADPVRLRAEGREFLGGLGFDLEGYRAASRLTIDKATVDYVESNFGRGETQEWIAGGVPLVYYVVYFKKPGETIWYSVNIHPDQGVLGWSRFIQEDYPGARISVEEARKLALETLAGALALDPSLYQERSASMSEQPQRRTHRFGFERVISESPDLRERVIITVAGEEIIGGSRRLIVPDAARRLARTRQGPAVALETVGFILLVACAVGAFFIFLSRLRGGTVDLARAAVWPSIVFVCLMGTFALESTNLFNYWEPLWPRWISALRYLALRAIEQIWLLVVLLAVIAAGDALDREGPSPRGAALWALGRGRVFDPGVARASARGFIVGLLCGGVLASSVIVLQWIAGAQTVIQPRGFFFYTLNSAAPALASLLFFLGVALAEELGYRFFGGNWVMALTGRKWLAILIPGVIYGLVHTRLDFLPPAEPFWARPLVLTLVGCAWGWTFFRYDALTVVLSHFTADLFIFNWPRLASGDPATVAVSLLTVSVPLIPAVLRPAWVLLRTRRTAAPG